MKKCKLAAMAWLSVCIVLFTSCGNSAGVSAGSTSEVKSTAVSESSAEEKQPYEILREKEDETKQIAADEEQQVKELQDALAVGSVLGAVILSLLKKNRTDAE